MLFCYYDRPTILFPIKKSLNTLELPEMRQVTLLGVNLRSPPRDTFFVRI
jgi:hypothetical protein